MKEINREMSTQELKQWKKSLTYSPTHLEIFEAGVKFAVRITNEPQKCRVESCASPYTDDCTGCFWYL